MPFCYHTILVSRLSTDIPSLGNGPVMASVRPWCCNIDKKRTTIRREANSGELSVCVIVGQCVKLAFGGDANKPDLVAVAVLANHEIPPRSSCQIIGVGYKLRAVGFDHEFKLAGRSRLANLTFVGTRRVFPDLADTRPTTRCGGSPIR